MDGWTNGRSDDSMNEYINVKVQVRKIFSISHASYKFDIIKLYVERNRPRFSINFNMQWKHQTT